MTRLSLLFILATLLTHIAVGQESADDPRRLGVNEHLVRVCLSWQRVNERRSVTQDQVFEAGLCQGYWMGAFVGILQEKCDEYVHGSIPGFSLAAAIPVMTRIWREHGQDKSFAITGPTDILGRVADDLLGPKEGRLERCRSTVLGSEGLSGSR